MSFYQSISEIYNKIFPLNPAQAQFTNGAFAQTDHLSLLDIGCGTGALTRALSATFKNVVGIDLDRAMLEQTKVPAEKRDNLKFSRLDMLEIEQYFGTEAFDAIVCFGNTLVHLSSMEQISIFLKKCHKVLTPGGKLLIQIISYDRILDREIRALPTLETDEIKFIRNYYYLEDRHLIDFETILTLKKTRRTTRNKVQLFPIRKSEMESALMEAGFKDIRFFGNFKRDPLTLDSIPMIIEASR